MKKLLLLLLIVSLSAKTKAQVVFCPPGAQWHYLFSGIIFWPGTTFNEPIKYVGDSIEGTDNLKILRHNRSSLFCGISNSITLIKQKGDTIFFKSFTTQNTWQILYNFAAQPGQTWQTTVLAINPSSKTFTTTVQAVGSVNINGFNLKTLSVSTTSLGQHTITERFGSNSFLFNFAIKNPGSCDANMYMEFLCYQDSSFGLKQFGDKSCDYRTSNGVGLTEGENINGLVKTYPNPVSDFLNVDLESSSDEMELSILDLQGREVRKFELQQKHKLDLGDLKEGMYFISICKDRKVIYSGKFIRTN